MIEPATGTLVTNSPKRDSKHQQNKLVKLFVLSLTVVILVSVSIKFWNTGTLKIGSFYINGWTPFNNAESYFYFGKYGRDTALNNLIQIQRPIVTSGNKVAPLLSPTSSAPKSGSDTEETGKPIYYEFKIPPQWEYGTNSWGVPVVKKGNPFCNCGYECYGINDICKDEELNTYGEISIITDNFCERFANVFPAKCDELTTDNFLENKDSLFPERNTGIIEKEGCGPFNVAGFPSITKIGEVSAIAVFESESCRYPSDRELYIYLPGKTNENLINISIRNYNLYKTEIDKALSTFKIIKDPFRP